MFSLTAECIGGPADGYTITFCGDILKEKNILCIPHFERSNRIIVYKLNLIGKVCFEFVEISKLTVDQYLEHFNAKR